MIKLLNHGFVRLVSYTQPAEGILHIDDKGRNTHPDKGWTGDLEVVRNARTSYQGSWRTGVDALKDAKLVERLLLSHHTSPFEAMHFTFEVQAPIFVFRQWHRHRTWAYSEDSARYTELPELYWLPDLERMVGQHKTDKQMSGEQFMEFREIARAFMDKHNADGFALYRKLMELGMAREMARTVLPLATFSHMFGTVNLGNLLKFLMLRMDKHAQYEIRVYASAMRQLIKAICPVTVEVYDTSYKVQQVVQQAIERARAAKTGLLEIGDVTSALQEELAAKFNEAELA